MIRTLSVLCVVLALAGCVTPVIPLPPPKLGDLSFTLTSTGTDQVVQLKGLPNVNHGGAWIFVVNVRDGRGVMKEAADDGSFTTEPLRAQDKDRIHVWAAHTYYEATGDVTCGLLDFASKTLKPCQ